MLILALGAVVLIAAAIVGGLALLHQRTGQSAQAGPSRGATPSAASAAPSVAASPTPSATHSATPRPSPTPTLAVVPAAAAAATAAGHQDAWTISRDRLQALLAAEQALLRSRGRLPIVGHLPGAPLPGIHRGFLPFPVLPRGGLPHLPPRGFHRP